MTKKRRIVLIAILIFIVLTGWRFYKIKTAPRAKSIEQIQIEKGLPVRVFTVQSGPLEETISISGAIEAFADSTITTKVADKIKQLHVKTGDFVEQNQLLVTLDDTKSKLELQAAQAQLARAQANFNLQQIELERKQQMYQQQAATLQQVQIQENQFKIARAELELASANVGLSTDMLENHYIKAPFAGLVSLKKFEQGDYVDLKQEIFHVLDISKVWQIVDVSEIYLRHIKQDMQVRVTVDALPGAEFFGVIEEINPMANVQSRDFRTRILIDNSDKTLRPGMFARSYIITNNKENTFVVPADAVRTSGEKKYALNVNADGFVEEITLKIGKNLGDMIEVVDGLKDGMRLITLAGENIKPGMKVQVEFSSIQNPKSKI